MMVQDLLLYTILILGTLLLNINVLRDEWQRLTGRQAGPTVEGSDTIALRRNDDSLAA